MERGQLILCATPIGNLKDITLRALDALREADYIAAEDTRHTLKLLNHYDIKKPLISYHRHNEFKRGQQILELVEKGHNVVLVTDAGMPGISDPGAQIVKEALEMGIIPTVLPGATAFVSALVISGICTERFVFEGFLPKKRSDRSSRLKDLAKEERTIIFYETPHRIKSILKEFLDIFGEDRPVAIVREITKLHEELIRGTLSEVLKEVEKRNIKGEIVVVLEGASEDIAQVNFDMSVKEHILKYMQDGLIKKDAIERVSKDRDMPKSMVYEHSTDLPISIKREQP
ncbi:MAG: 16S rRNA (cytidine(1402)-2'-O)-methyltransferase [Clostridiales bacterium]|nr:16S rRNA (cytidine(1402)-2'-O)-methyltransferase [Clostridiales bacterium]